MRSSASAGTRPARSVSSRPAAYLDAHPPARVSEVSETVSTPGNVGGRRPAGRGEHSVRRDPSPSPLPLTQRPPPPRRPLLFPRLARVRSALVTGGSSGLGLTLARMLRDEGYELTLVARRPEPLEEAASELGAFAVAANLSDIDECVRVVAAHADRYGGMDVLVNSA